VGPRMVTSRWTELLSLIISVWLFILRQDMKFLRLNCQCLRLRNKFSRASVVAPEGPIVSLTTYGQRMHTVYLTIESIGRGSLLPSQLILWIQDHHAFTHRPVELRRLERRGLEVRLTESYGSHSKYYPYLLATDEFSKPLVTADDDALYNSWWLAGLTNAHELAPCAVHCYRARVVRLVKGGLAPYVTWTKCRSVEPGNRIFATGASGCIYPAEFLPYLKRAGTTFLYLCPRADDVWLHLNALRSGFTVRQVFSRPLEFPSIPGTQHNALYKENCEQGENDVQISVTYKVGDLALLTGTGETPEQAGCTFAS